MPTPIHHSDRCRRGAWIMAGLAVLSIYPALILSVGESVGARSAVGRIETLVNASQAARSPVYLDTLEEREPGTKRMRWMVRWLDEYSQVRQVWVDSPDTRDRLIAWIEGGDR